MAARKPLVLINGVKQEIPAGDSVVGAGDVTKVGTPVDNQVGVWTGDGTLEGVTTFTYDGQTLAVAATDIASGYLQTITNTTTVTTGFPVRNGLLIDVPYTVSSPGGSTASKLLHVRQYGTNLFYLDGGGSTFQFGSVNAVNGFFSGSWTAVRGTLSNNNGGLITLTTKAAAAQTANIQEWQNSAGTALGGISNTAQFRLGKATLQSGQITIEENTAYSTDILFRTVLGGIYAGSDIATFSIKGNGECYSYNGFNADVAGVGFTGKNYIIQGGHGGLYGQVSASSTKIQGSDLRQTYGLNITTGSGYPVALANGVNPMSYHVYNTIGGTLGANYERGVMGWQTTSNILTIGAQAGGTGTLRAVQIVGSSLTFNGAIYDTLGADVIGQTIKGFSSQTANLSEWRSSANVLLASFSKNGELSIPGVGANSQKFGLSSTVAGANGLAAGQGVVLAAAAARSTGIGNTISILGPDAIAIGYNISLGVNGDKIAIGNNITATGATGFVLIGKGISGGTESCVGIGRNCVVSSGGTTVGDSASNSNTGGICIGRNTTLGGNSYVNITDGGTVSGAYGIGIGKNTAVTHSSCIAFNGSTTAANQMVFGGGNDQFFFYKDMYLGGGVVSAYTAAGARDFTLHGTGGSGTNAVGASVAIAGGKATGNATGGDIIFKTSDAGASGTTLQTLSEKGRIDATTGDMNILGHITQAGCFAEIHVHDASTAQSIATGATYIKITAFTDNGLSANCTADATNDKITLTKTGIYRVSGSVNFLSDTNNVVFKMTPFLNAVEQDHIHIQRKVATLGDVGSASFTGFIDVTTAAWDLDLRCAHDNGGAVNITISYANLNVEYIGRT